MRPICPLPTPPPQAGKGAYLTRGTAIDIPNLLNQTGDKLEASSRDGDVLVFHIRKS